MTSASSMYEAGHSNTVLWDNTEGWGGEGGVEGDSGWGNTGAAKGDSHQCMAKTITIL